MPTRDSLSAMSLSYDDSITQKLIWLDVCHGAGCSDWTWTRSRDCFLFWTQTVSYFSTGKEGSPSWFWGLSSLFVFTPSWVIMSSVFCFTFSLRPLLQHRSDDSGETLAIFHHGDVFHSAGRISSLWVCSLENTAVTFSTWSGAQV